MENSPELQPYTGYIPEQAPPSKPLYNNFLEAGRKGKNEWWRYLIGIVIVFAAYIIGQVPLTFYALAMAQKNGHTVGEIMDNSQKILDPAWIGAPREMVLILTLTMFVFAMAGLFLAVRALHGKKFRNIITSAPKIRWKRFAITACTWMVLCFIGQYISILMYPDNYTIVFNLKPFLMTLLIGVIFLPVQTWWEEYFFRGYIFQGIGLVTKNAIAPILVTGLIFASIHMFNPEVAAYGALAMFPAYLIPGIFLAMMTALDEGLESAMGMHFANNLFGTFAVTSSSSAIQANTIWYAKGMNPGADNLTILISFIILMGILSYTNKWNFAKLYR